MLYIFPEKEWKQGANLVGLMTPKFMKEADVAEFTSPKLPLLKMCVMDSDGHLKIAEADRQKWLSDPVRSLLVRLLNFHSFSFLHLVGGKFTGFHINPPKPS